MCFTGRSWTLVQESSRDHAFREIRKPVPPFHLHGGEGCKMWSLVDLHKPFVKDDISFSWSYRGMEWFFSALVFGINLKFSTASFSPVYLVHFSNNETPKRLYNSQALSSYCTFLPRLQWLQPGALLCDALSTCLKALALSLTSSCLLWASQNAT